MAAENKSVMNHLLREIMHTIRIKGDSDAMGYFALSSKEVFSAFRFVVGNHVCLDVYRDYEKVICDKDSYSMALALEGYTPELKQLMIPFIQEVDLKEYRAPLQLPCEAITKLTLNLFRVPTNGSYAAILDSWPDIEVLTLNFVNNAFFDEVVGGNILLTNLHHFNLIGHAEQFVHLMTMATPFPLPAKVNFDIRTLIGTPFMNVYNPVPMQTFPDVRQFSIRFILRNFLHLDMLNQFPVIVQCFTTLELAEFEYTSSHSWFPGYLPQIGQFHEWIDSANFSAPVEITYTQCVDIAHVVDDKTIYEGLKSLGYTEDGNEYDFVIIKMHPTVKLTHRIRHSDSSSDNEELLADELQDYVNEMALDAAEDDYFDGDDYDDYVDDAYF